MTHDQIVAALRRGYQLDDARESRRGCYPLRKPALEPLLQPRSLDRATTTSVSAGTSGVTSGTR